MTSSAHIENSLVAYKTCEEIMVNTCQQLRSTNVVLAFYYENNFTVHPASLLDKSLAFTYYQTMTRTGDALMTPKELS